MGCSSGILGCCRAGFPIMCEWRLSHSRFVEAFSGVWGCFRAESLLCVSGGCHIGGLGGVGGLGEWLVFGVLRAAGVVAAVMCEWRLAHCVPDGVFFGHLEVLPCRIFAMCEWRLSHWRSGVVVVWEGRWGCWVLDCLGWAGAAMCEWRLAHRRSAEAFSGVWGCFRAGFPVMCEWRLSHCVPDGAFPGVWGFSRLNPCYV